MRRSTKEDVKALRHSYDARISELERSHAKRIEQLEKANEENKLHYSRENTMIFEEFMKLKDQVTALSGLREQQVGHQAPMTQDVPSSSAPTHTQVTISTCWYFEICYMLDVFG